MKLIEKIKSWFCFDQPEELEAPKANFRIYRHRPDPNEVPQVYVGDSEKAKKIRFYQAMVQEDTPGYLLLDTFGRPLWSQDDFIDQYWHHIERAQILHCQPKFGGKDFYIFASPYIKDSGLQGWIGFIIGSDKEVYVSVVNHTISEAPKEFKVPIEYTHCYLSCETISCPDPLQRVLGSYPEVKTVCLFKTGKDGRNYCLGTSRQWPELFADIKRLEQNYK